MRPSMAPTKPSRPARFGRAFIGVTAEKLSRCSTLPGAATCASHRAHPTASEYVGSGLRVAPPGFSTSLRVADPETMLLDLTIEPSGSEDFDRARRLLADAREDEALDWFEVASGTAEQGAVRASAALHVAAI